MSKVISFPTNNHLFSQGNGQTTNSKDSNPNAEQAPPKKIRSFAEIASQNAANAERLRKERLNANKGVLKSYKIK